MTTKTLPALPPVSSLESYVQAVNTVPMLTLEREIELGRRLKDGNDLTAARDLVLSHLRLVVSVARNYMGYGLPQADLIQEGNIGLMKAVKRFDPERGVRLASFAIHWIKAEIHEYILRNWRMVKIATTKAQRKLFFNLRSMKKSTVALTPTEITQVAQTLNVKESDVIEMEKRLQGGDVALEPATDDGDDHASRPSPTSPMRPKGPRRLYEREQSETLKQRRPHAGAGEPGRTQPPHHPRALARRRRSRRRCTSSPTSSACRPSASARSRPRRCRR